MTSSELKRDAVAVSIIVPVFNVEPYVEECLQSLLDQDFEDEFEILMIDDASTDASGDICQRFSSGHPDRCRFFRLPQNQGVSAARNRGLDNAIGRYFMFVDPDDLLPPDSVSLLHGAALKSGASIVKGNNSIFGLSSEKPARYNVDRPELLRGEAILITLMEHEKTRGHAGGKLFLRKAFAEQRFPDGINMGEDLIFCCATFASAESVYLLDRSVYRYRNRSSSTTGTLIRSGGYRQWLETVRSLETWVRSPLQHRAHRNLMVRTLTQLARESRGLSEELSASLLADFESTCRQWRITAWQILVRERLGIRSLARYFKLRLALAQIRNSLSSSR